MVLRQELFLARQRGVSVCTVMPAEIATPSFRQAGNLLGREAKAMPPVYPPEQVARAIVHCTAPSCPAGRSTSATPPGSSPPSPW